jgi:hypothetical protein
VLELERSLLANKKNVPLAHLYTEKQVKSVTTTIERENVVNTDQNTTNPHGITYNVQSIEEEHIEANRLPLQKIREIPKFEKYDPDTLTPTKVCCCVLRALIFLKGVVFKKPTQKS